MLTKTLYLQYLEALKKTNFIDDLIAFQVLTNSTRTRTHQIERPMLELPFTNRVIGTDATLAKAEANLAKKLFAMVKPLKSHNVFQKYSYLNFCRLKKLAKYDEHFMNAYYDKQHLYRTFESLGIGNQDKYTFMSLLYLNKLSNFESDHEINVWLTESREINKVTKDWNE